MLGVLTSTRDLSIWLKTPSLRRLSSPIQQRIAPVSDALQPSFAVLVGTTLTAVLTLDDGLDEGCGLLCIRRVGTSASYENTK